MKILFITDNFPPEVNAPATRTYEHCKRWVELGAEITVITCAPNFPQGEVYEGYRNQIMQKEVVDGIEVIRVWSYITSNEGFLKRTLDYLSFAISSFWVGLFQKTDLIIATSPQFFTTWSGFGLSALKRKPWIFELRDLWPESISAVGALKEGLVLKTLEQIELYLYRNSNLVIPNSQAFKINLVERGIQANKIHVIPNGSNLELYKPQPKNEKLLNKLGLNGKFVAGYLGTHGLAHNLDFILNCAAKVNDPNVHFLFIGDGAEKNNLQQQAKQLSLENISFLDPIPKQKVPDYLSVFDVSLVPLKKADTFKTVIPSKIFEAAAMQIPILLGVEGQAKEIIQTYKAGLCYVPENEADFLEKLASLKNNAETYRKLSLNGQKLAEAYDRNVLAGEMYEVMQTLNGKSG